MSKKIRIGRDAYDQIMYYVHKAKFEISGLGNVRIIDGIPTVTDIYLLKQENDPTETEIDADAVAKCVYDHHVSGVEGTLNFWWHSHVDMGVFWSGTDMATIKQLTENGWFIHGVFNKKNQHRIAYSNNEPMEVFIDEIPMEIEESLTIHPEKQAINEMLEKLEEDFEKQQEELYAKYDEIDGKKCDELFDAYVTDKPQKTYTSWYDNGYVAPWHNTVTWCYETNKQIKRQRRWSRDKGDWEYRDEVEKELGKSLTETSQNILTIPSTGKEMDIFDAMLAKRFLDLEGALELRHLGYTDNQIEVMQDKLYIYDAEDLSHYEMSWGNPSQDMIDLGYLDDEDNILVG